MGNTLKSRIFSFGYLFKAVLTLLLDFVAALGEFVGTTMFLFFAFAGTQVANVGGRNNQSSTTGGETGFSPEVLLYISLVFGFSLMVNVWVFFRISGGIFNPAVSLIILVFKHTDLMHDRLLSPCL
jgi:aquaporin related protein